jgi:methionyl-tRNA formyltransferase
MTLHQLDAQEDHGMIYAQSDFAWPHRATGDDLYTRAGALAGDMLVELLPKLQQGPLRGVPQDDRLASRAPRPKPEDAYVEPWEWECEHLVDFACGAGFFRTPWMRLGEDIFFMRTGVGAEVGRRMPGQYLLQGSQLTVQCKDGLAHLEIQV